MFKYRIRMFFNELKVLVFMRSDSRQSSSDTDRRSNTNTNTNTTMRGLGMGGCGWPPFVDCHSRDDEEEYYGSDPRPRSLAFEEKEPKLQVGLDAVSLASTASSLRTPQCRICFQGPEQVAKKNKKKKKQSEVPDADATSYVDGGRAGSVFVSHFTLL